MSRGRKSKGNEIGQDWESLYRKNSGIYFNILIKELGKQNEVGNDSGLELYNQLKNENNSDKKQLPLINHEEIPFEIPKNWVWCKLGEIGESTIGLIFKPSQVGKVGIPVLRANNVQDNRIDYSELISVDIKVRDKQVAKTGDILICVRSGSNNLIGKSALIEKEGMSFGAFMSLYRSNINIYIHRFMTSALFKSQIDDKKSTGINQLTQGTLNNILIPLPPISEQHKILDFFNAFENDTFIPTGSFFNIDIENRIFRLHKSQIKAATIKAEIKFQLTQIENLNQAILLEAVQGKLLPQNKKDESANEILKQLKAEKEKLNKKEKPLPPIKPEEIPFDIPDNWVWCRLGEIFQIERGSSPRPKGDPRYFSKAKTKYNWITISDMTEFANDKPLSDTREFLTELGTKHSRYVTTNDIIIVASGSAGRSALLGIDGYIYDGLMSVKNIKEDTTKMFLFYLFKVFEASMMKIATGATWQNINTDILKNQIIPLPPLAEQKRIVSEIDKQLNKTKQLKEHIIANQQATEQLLKALLHQAFEVEEMETN